MKKMITFVATLIMAWATCMPVSAATSDFFHFPLVTNAMGRNYMSATVAVQKFMVLDNSTYYWRIRNNGGVDGFYGDASVWVTEHFQSTHNLSADGKVGSKTWMKMESCMDKQDNSTSDSDGSIVYTRMDNSENNTNTKVIVQEYNRGPYHSVDLYGNCKEVFYRPHN